MKATGIVRRIDDLGRVVIPKEIRRTMRIREGDPLEIYTDKDGGVIFKKYSLMGGLGDFAAVSNFEVMVTSWTLAAVTLSVWIRPLSLSTPMWALYPKCHSLPFFT